VLYLFQIIDVENCSNQNYNTTNPPRNQTGKREKKKKDLNNVTAGKQRACCGVTNELAYAS